MENIKEFYGNDDESIDFMLRHGVLPIEVNFLKCEESCVSAVTIAYGGADGN